ncbi:MAG: hypothetical protein SVV03_03550, partial [Candidatus Nanohaloarchaea archaeon]|nr:hypothetical protein [Candidatus Nanohaloarchaea archaeon]
PTWTWKPTRSPATMSPARPRSRSTPGSKPRLHPFPLFLSLRETPSRTLLYVADVFKPARHVRKAIEPGELEQKLPHRVLEDVREAELETDQEESGVIIKASLSRDGEDEQKAFVTGIGPALTA